ncbi:MAG TPA: alpha/beta hydrolase [Pseudonocardia sp.]|jgi:pimeloyl-ACP methyl ester carboxylesterase|nr:alpha/beta hydrolase [Pseudonocardia sp.]
MDKQDLPAVSSFVPSAPWGGHAHVCDLGGPVHWVDFGDPGTDRPPMVLVHGLGGSHLNWVSVAPELARHTRVVAIDLPGFGLTPTLGRSAAVRANAELLARFVDEVVGAPAILVGNSMGGMISLLVADAHPRSVAALVLVNPSVPQPAYTLDREVALAVGTTALPMIGARIARRLRTGAPARQAVERVHDLCFADARRTDPEVVEAAVALTEYRLEQPPEDRAFSAAARSLISVARRRARYYALMRRVAAPVLLVHGTHDRLVSQAAADKVAEANPNWEYLLLDGVGHTPQMEVPDRFADGVLAWLGRAGVLPAD